MSQIDRFPPSAARALPSYELGEEEAAIRIQRLFRGHRARLMCTELNSVPAIRIVDAKDAGMGRRHIESAIDAIAGKELQDDIGMISPWSYVKEEYFTGAPIKPGASSPELILLAMKKATVVGFIITRKSKELKEGDFFAYAALPADTGYVAYLAVDSDCKRSGAGTKLMLAAMKKTKELGKRYLTLEYIAKGVGVDKTRGKTKEKFYNSFATRFGIPTEEKGNMVVDRQLHVRPHYDLQDVDFDALR
jgi:ribosomal protein S18 acetylase RimI-like enzyme